MTDIVKRLRNKRRMFGEDGSSFVFDEDIEEAADEIERLRTILNVDPDSWIGPPWRPIATAPRDDDTEVLLMHPANEHGGHQYALAFFDTRERRWQSEGAAFPEQAFEWWMPLPPPEAGT